jgi:cytochrome c-type biogenesis protein CcmH/NrfG
MYVARCTARLGEKIASENNWKRALEAAGGDSGKLMTLAEYAERNGANEIAEVAYATATNEFPKLRAAWQGRLRLAQVSGRTKKIHAVLTGTLAIWPNDSAIKNDEAYTQLLLLFSNSQDDEARMTNDQTLKEIEQLAKKLVERNPRSLPHRTLLALARLRQNRTSEALDVYANIQVAPNALTPSALAVHAAVLAANGRINDAKAEAAQVKVDNLLPEEKALIQNLL